MNKLPNNKTLQTYNENIYYVIIIWRDGCWKYISKNYGHKYAFDYSVKMSKAKRFDTIEAAERFVDYNDLHGRRYHICSMECNYRVKFNEL